MKEIPIPYVRANQTGIVLFVVLAILFQQPFLIAALWAIQMIGLWQGVRANLIVQLAAPLLRSRIAGAQTEAAELQRFNNSIAVALLTLSILSFWLMPGGWIGYLFAGVVAIAAFVAICGFCVGCFIYFQFKQLRRR
ncbi:MULTISPECIES: DUF4395 domain-containing protein [unclassified Paenibacillus]|uniref:DUF4395 domain-containing protein n=1 Tax=unclassified Paenibacillus TaxID=185978 RepID=UPI001AE9A91C|nr:MULTISPECIES: DUF4395 domain-containing protein [unclassified Paenibacillus]MBP1155621.1 hypothetical protein [Paenibacillus sp. PvP091]MBP1168993.1 hypothetical protein [Paenibacillus sp. PvR098]MBP2440021.1 hypothetical protein [Paenibacillus sp. PvP052]